VGERCSGSEVLAGGVVRIVKPLAARQAVRATSASEPGCHQITQPSTKPVNEQVVLIPKGEVEQLIKQIGDSRTTWSGFAQWQLRLGEKTRTSRGCSSIK